MKKDRLSPENLKRLADLYKNDIDPTALELAVHLLIAASEMERVMEKHFGKFGLSQCRFSAMMMLFHATDHKAKPIEMADHLGVTRANMTGILDNLERDKLIVRKSTKTDKRINFVCLTPKGLKLIDQILPFQLRRNAHYMQNLSEKDRAQMGKFLEQIRLKMKPFVAADEEEFDQLLKSV